MDSEEQKVHIERAISRARDGVSRDIDELDSRLRTQFDPKTLATTYAPHIIGAGAVLGLIVGFGVPKYFRRLVTFGVPLAILAVTIKNARNGDGYDDFEPIE
jgi:hypothetical protein